MRKKLTENLINEIREYYKNNVITLGELAKKYGLCSPTIGKILEGIPRYKKAILYSPDLNEEFFSKIDCDSKAYFLGLIVSDGNVFYPKDGRQKSLSISLKNGESEIKVLERFKKELNTSTSVANHNGFVTLAVRSNKIADDLSRYGVVPRKTLLTYLPNIDDNYMGSFMRGLVDGDGSIRALQHKNKYLHGIEVCGTHRLMKELSDYINSHFRLKSNVSVYDYKNRELSEINISNISDMYAIGEWIYSNSDLFLDRKHELYLKFKEHYSLT